MPETKKDIKWVCTKCGKTISHPFQPHPQVGGKCPKAKGTTSTHNWTKK